jgi:hypothetical protein
MNVHDEVMVVAKPDVTNQIAQAVTKVVESYRDRVPLIRMDWMPTGMRNWGDKNSEDIPKIIIGPKAEDFTNEQDAEKKLAEALDDFTIEGSGFAEWDEGLENLCSDDIDFDTLFNS